MQSPIEISTPIDSTKHKNLHQITPIETGQTPKTISVKSEVIVGEIVRPNVELSDKSLQQAEVTHLPRTVTLKKV